MSRAVQSMFAQIAPRYDRANRVLSFGIDQRWRRRAAAAAAVHPTDVVLDLACGTGDLSLLLQRRVSTPVTGADFTWEMLPIAARKTAKRHAAARYVCADALRLPFADATFDAVTIAFGIRNLDDPVAGLREMARVVRPGGRVVVLEFGQPTGLFGRAYRAYARHVMPRVGGLVTGARAAYEYLPRTAAQFPAGAAFLRLMDESDAFASHSLRRLTGGVAYVYVGVVR